MRQFGKAIKEVVTTVLLAFILALLIRNYIVDARVIPSGSMLPTIQQSDRILVNKLAYSFKEPQRGDIIVFEAPVNVGDNQDFIKRVIALPGETVEIKNGKVFINGKPLEEDYILEAPNYNFGPVKVPEGCLFVLGDNRNSSYDSHLWNVWLRIDKVKGKAFLRYWPPNRIGFID
ncbi:MAG TPA: signal peptidase I [Peptococcaceae bacterium]|nr:MAG: Signal peptidase I [Clostridia bacterium 41_269]HBT19978.1 signal peptidase I [Peptococcaceae bacterium]